MSPATHCRRGLILFFALWASTRAAASRAASFDPVPLTNKQARPSRFSASLVGCDGRPAEPFELVRGLARPGSWHDTCDLRLPAWGPVTFTVGNLLEMQVDPSSFEQVAGTTVVNRVWVPGLRVGLGGTRISLCVGSLASANLWGLLSVRFEL